MIKSFENYLISQIVDIEEWVTCGVPRMLVIHEFTVKNDRFKPGSPCNFR